MSKTYLITGATSPLGLVLMDRLLPTLAEGDLILAQGSGDLARLASLCQSRPGFIRPYDVDFTQPLAVRAFLSDLADSYPVPTHLIHLAGMRDLPAPTPALTRSGSSRAGLSCWTAPPCCARLSCPGWPRPAGAGWCSSCPAACRMCPQARWPLPPP